VRARLAGGAAAPHLVDAEVGQAVRGLVLRGMLDAKLAAAHGPLHGRPGLTA
jgi:hypothetical protein